MIVVDFEEFKPETYKGVYLFDSGKTLFKSYLGSFEKDYKTCVKAGRKLAKEQNKTLINSSSVDDWYMDSRED
jgi:hypothetical protein